MMGSADAQPALSYQVSLEQLETVDHPMRAIRLLIDRPALEAGLCFTDTLLGSTYATFTSMAFGFAFSDFGR